ncbi:MAG: DUF167 domain-containing protein [Candidatus Hermodarchaeota archaeon]
MDFIKKYSGNSYVIYLNVKTNSKKQDIKIDGNFLTIFLRSKPIQNKANKELFSLLRKRLKISSNQIEFISGAKSNNKSLKINFLEEIEEQEILKKLIE